jgi:hypothetical protein
MNTVNTVKMVKNENISAKAFCFADSCNYNFLSKVLLTGGFVGYGKQFQKKTMFFHLQEISFSKFVRCFNKN